MPTCPPVILAVVSPANTSTKVPNNSAAYFIRHPPNDRSGAPSGRSCVDHLRYHGGQVRGNERNATAHNSSIKAGLFYMADLVFGMLVHVVCRIAVDAGGGRRVATQKSKASPRSHGGTEKGET